MDLFRFVCQWVGKRIAGFSRSSGRIHDNISQHMFLGTWLLRNENEVSTNMCHYSIKSIIL